MPMTTGVILEPILAQAPARLVLISIFMLAKSIPDIVVARLPLYLRALADMESRGTQYTSSQALGARLGISSAQIRKDLSHFGEFGKQGTGYSVEELQTRLRHILRIEKEWPVVIIGAGQIGRALAAYPGFAHRGFLVCGIFDSDAARIGDPVGSQRVQHVDALAEVIRSANVRIAMIAVPAQSAQVVADQLVSYGIAALLNYAPLTLNVPASVRVENIDPVLHLQHMTYYLD